MEKKYVRKKANGGQVIHWKSNSDSFRGPELIENPEYRIIVYGDSNIQARFSERANTYPVRLQNHLEQAGVSGVEIVNAGVIGFAPDQHLLRFSKEVDRYQPDMIIFHVFADNDFGDLLRNQLFSVDENGDLLPIIHENTPRKDKFANYRSKKIKAFFQEMLLTRSVKRLLGLVKGNPADHNNDPNYLWNDDKESRDSLLQELCIADHTLYKQRTLKANIVGDCFDMDIAINPEAESSKTKIELMEAVLKEARDLAQAKGVRFLVLIQPSVIDMTRDNGFLPHSFIKTYP